MGGEPGYVAGHPNSICVGPELRSELGRRRYNVGIVAEPGSDHEEDSRMWRTSSEPTAIGWRISALRDAGMRTRSRRPVGRRGIDPAESGCRIGHRTGYRIVQGGADEADWYWGPPVSDHLYRRRGHRLSEVSPGRKCKSENVAVNIWAVAIKTEWDVRS